MRVAILGPFNVIGGVSTVVEEIASAFLRRGDEVTIITLESLQKTPSHQERLCIFAPSKSSKLVSVKNIFSLIKLAKFLRQMHYDIVVSNLYYSILLSIAKSDKKIHIMNGMGRYSPSLKGSFRAKVGNYSNVLGANLADTIIANSYQTAVIYNSIYGIKSNVVPLGVSLTASDSLPKENRQDIDLLYVGRLASVKEIPIALKAVALLSRTEQKPINFHIIGDGPEAENLKALTKNLDIESQVIFHGYLPRQQLSEFYLRSRCFISLDPYEPFGLTYLEALVHGIPIILCRGNGFSPFSDNRFACLVDCYPKSVADGIHRALKTQWDREWISKYVLEIFSWDKTLDLILNAIHQTEQK